MNITLKFDAYVGEYFQQTAWSQCLYCIIGMGVVAPILWMIMVDHNSQLAA